MAYGEDSMAYKVLARNPTEDQIIAQGRFARDDGEFGTVRFADKSFIEIRRFNNHQAFLSNGWNVTPSRLR